MVAASSAVAGQDLLGKLVRDAIYNIQKDAVRVVLVALFSVLLRQLTRQNNPATAATLAGAVAVLISLAAAAASTSAVPAQAPVPGLLQWLGLAPPAPPLLAPPAASPVAGFKQLAVLLWTHPTLLATLLACVYLIDRFDLHMKGWTLMLEAFGDARPHLMRLLHLQGHSTKAQAARRRGGAVAWTRKIPYLLPLPAILLTQRLAAARLHSHRVAKNESRRLQAFSLLLVDNISTMA